MCQNGDHEVIADCDISGRIKYNKDEEELKPLLCLNIVREPRGALTQSRCQTVSLSRLYDIAVPYISRSSRYFAKADL